MGWRCKSNDLSYSYFEVLPNAITRLRNLLTLKVNQCRQSKKFPKNVRELINLRHFENHGCGNLTHMPAGIGKLTLLQSLPLFVVGSATGWLRTHKFGSLSELKSLNHLRGGLCIRNLQNVRDIELVSKGEILERKQCLQSLRLEWERSGEDVGDEGDKLVMEGLQPHPYLKELLILGYGGTEFPSWMMNDGLGSLLPNVIEIEISGCSRCRILPPFSQLPSLKSLNLDDMKEVEELNKGSSATPLFPALESLKLSDMPKLEHLWRMDLLAEEGPSFSLLSELYIHKCSSLASLELQSPPSLSQLEINDCPNLTSLELHSSPSLSQLDIDDCPNMTSLELHSSPSLSQLEIDDCRNLTSLELHSSPSLSYIKIINCPNLASFNVASLPCLEDLRLRGVRAKVLRQLMFVSASSSLKSLCIMEIDGTISVPEEPLQYVSTLETLHVVKCSGLATLLHWLGSLSSLTELIICDCSELTSVPEEIYSLKKLQTFYFCEYPELKEIYNKETGEDRAKIAHIPNIYFESNFLIESSLN